MVRIMKQKLIALLLLISVIVPCAAFAEDSVPTTSQDIYGWIRIDTKNTDPTLYDTINVVEDETYGHAIEAIKQSGVISNSALGISQKISADKLTEGNTYVFEFAYKMEKYSTAYWIQAGFPWNDFVAPASLVDGGKGWRTGKKEVVYTASKFSGGLPVRIHSANGKAHYWIADVKVYDKADETKTNLLKNGDFSESYKSIENLSYSDGTLSWTIPEGMPEDMKLNIYRRNRSGDKVLLNASPILASSLSYTVTDIPENSFWLDVCLVDGSTELTGADLVKTCAVVGAIDFGEYKFYSESGEITKLESGKITVALPVANNKYSDGYNMEMIVLLKNGNVTEKLAKKAYVVPQSENGAEYTVEIDAGDSIGENTHLEIYLWDSAESMNALRDVYVF